MQPGFRDIIATLGLRTGDTLLFHRQQPTVSAASAILNVIVSGRQNSASSAEEEDEEEVFIANLVSAWQQEELKANDFPGVDYPRPLSSWPTRGASKPENSAGASMVTTTNNSGF